MLLALAVATVDDDNRVEAFFLFSLSVVLELMCRMMCQIMDELSSLSIHDFFGFAFCFRTTAIKKRLSTFGLFCNSIAPPRLLSCAVPVSLLPLTVPLASPGSPFNSSSFSPINPNRAFALLEPSKELSLRWTELFLWWGNDAESG